MEIHSLRNYYRQNSRNLDPISKLCLTLKIPSQSYKPGINTTRKAFIAFADNRQDFAIAKEFLGLSICRNGKEIIFKKINTSKNFPKIFF